jgi:hypothetical protein
VVHVAHIGGSHRLCSEELLGGLCINGIIMLKWMLMTQCRDNLWAPLNMHLNLSVLYVGNNLTNRTDLICFRLSGL